MTELQLQHKLTHKKLVPQGILVETYSHIPPTPERSVMTVVVSPVETQSDEQNSAIEQLTNHLESLNSFLAEYGLPPFRLAELPLNQESGMVLMSPHDTMAIQITDEQGVVHTHHCPRILPEILAERGIEYNQEISYVQALDDRLMMVHFPMTPGPPNPGEEPQELLMSMIIEKVGAPKLEPVCLIGKTAELTKLAEQAPAFEPIRLTQDQFDELERHYADLETKFGGKTVRLSPNLIAETSNVAQITNVSVSGKFHRTLSFTMTDGSVRHRLVNRGELLPDNSRIQEGAGFVTTTPINGEQHVMITNMLRLTGAAPGYEGTTDEMPRAFSVHALNQAKYHYLDHMAESEAGISAQTLTTHQVNGAETLSSDQAFEDVNLDYCEFALPAGVDFQLAAKQDAEPTKSVEQLVPSWMSMRDAIETIRTGESFTESFSIAMLGVWLFRRGILTLKPQLPTGENPADLSIALEQVQDWRNGGVKDTLWRGDSQQFATVNGPMSPNNGNSRLYFDIGFDHSEKTTAALAQSTKSWRAISLPEFVDGITKLKWDNVTIASVLKVMLQQRFLDVHEDKLKA